MSGVKTQTLAEFLLARIAEDKAPTWTLAPYECAPGCCAPKGWVGSQCRYCDPAPVYGGTVEAMTSSAEEHAEAIHQRSRVLAECEVKRQIVCLATYMCGFDDPGGELGYQPLVASAGREVLRFLVAPYTSHPEFHEEWRP